MFGIIEGGSTSDKCGISGGSGGGNVSVTEKNNFVQSANMAMKINGAIAGYSATGKKKITARQWLALIGFLVVETQNQVQNIWKQIEKA